MSEVEEDVVQDKSIQVCFQVHGDFICDLVRTRLWDEEGPWDWCMEMLCSCLEGAGLTRDQQERTAIEIMEYRKVLSGVNSFTLEDDPGPIRPISLLIKRRDEKLALKAMVDDIQYHPMKYVDRYATHISTHRDLKWLDECTDNELIGWLRWGRRPRNVGTDDEDWSYPVGGQEVHMEDEDDYLLAGTYMLSNPRLAFAILGGKIPDKVWDSREVAEAQLKYWSGVLSEWKAKGLEYKDMNNMQKRVWERCWKGSSDFKNIPFPYQEEEEKIEKFTVAMEDVPPTGNMRAGLLFCEDEALVKHMLDTWFEPLPEAYTLDIPGAERYCEDLRRMAKNKHDCLQYTGTADAKQFAPIEEYGWIDPDGKWYSCTFGGHQGKAKSIVEAHKNLMVGYINWLITEHKQEINTGHDIWMAMMHDYDHIAPEDYLPTLGWCKFHNPNPRDYPSPTMQKPHKMSKAMEDAVFDVVIKFKFPYDPCTGQKYNWDELDKKGR